MRTRIYMYTLVTVIGGSGNTATHFPLAIAREVASTIRWTGTAAIRVHQRLDANQPRKPQSAISPVKQDNAHNGVLLQQRAPQRHVWQVVVAKVGIEMLHTSSTSFV